MISIKRIAGSLIKLVEILGFLSQLATRRQFGSIEATKPLLSYFLKRAALLIYLGNIKISPKNWEIWTQNLWQQCPEASLLTTVQCHFPPRFAAYVFLLFLFSNYIREVSAAFPRPDPVRSMLSDDSITTSNEITKSQDLSHLLPVLPLLPSLPLLTFLTFWRIKCGFIILPCRACCLIFYLLFLGLKGRVGAGPIRIRPR